MQTNILVILSILYIKNTNDRGHAGPFRGGGGGPWGPWGQFALGPPFKGGPLFRTFFSINNVCEKIF